MAGYQIIAANEDGRRRLPTVYTTREEAETEAKRMHRCSSAAVRDNGGEWFQCTFYHVVEAR